MAAISGRMPPVVVEFDRYGGRARRYFASPYAARRFYATKLAQGCNPKVMRATA